MHPSHPMKPFAVPNHWTTEQALAVVDLLDELREHLWAKYEPRLLEAYRQSHGPDSTDDGTKPFIDDEPI